jgi:PAS domain S-box-containing protein
MKIRSQFIISLIVFGIILIVTVASVILTSQQTATLSAQKEQAVAIQQGASNLNYLSNYYFLYQEDLKLDQWRSAFNSLSSDVSTLKLNNPAQQTLVNTLDRDLQNLQSVFESVVSYLQNAPRNVSIRIDPQFQTQWIRMALQNQVIAVDASQFSQAITNQADQLSVMSTALVFILFGTFGMYFLAIYLLIYRRALNSISNLQAETKIIGEGNLDHSIKIDRQDEIGELSHAFNQMTANLKTVTASKTDLEQEIIGRKQAETALRESEQRWATTLESIGDAVIATDLSGRITFMNDVAEELTGWTLSEASLKPVKQIFNIVNEQTHFEVEDPVRKVLEKGVIVGLANHTVLIRKNKTEVAIDDSGAPIKDKDGNIKGVVLVFRDITERKKNEDKISQQALMIANANDAIIGYDLDQRVTFWNKAAEQMYGYTTEEAMGKASIDILNPAYVNVTREELINRLASSGHVETESLRLTKDGRKLNIEAHVILLRDEAGKSIGYVSVDRDITQRNQMQAKLEEYGKHLEELVERRTLSLKASEEKYRTLFDSIDEGFCIVEMIFDNDGRPSDYRFLEVNSSFERQTGMHDAQGKLMRSFAPNHEAYWFETYGKVALTGEPIRFTNEAKALNRWYDVFAFPVGEGKIRKVAILFNDVSEHKLIEQKLSAASLYSRSLIEASLDPLVTISKEGEITDVNKATEEVTGCSREELIGSDFLDYFTEPEQARAGYQKVFTEGFVKDYPLAIRHKTGRITHVLYNASTYRNPKGEIQGIFAAARDITELKKAEEQEQETAKKLKDAERLAAIGATAGMVGHDIRNPLQAIIGDVYLAKGDVDSLKKSDTKESLQESIVAIEKNTEYINKIVADLQDFAKPLKPMPQETDLEAIFNELLLKNRKPENIKTSSRVTKDAKKLVVDPILLNRIIGNLITNAVQAMPNGGKLTINAHRETDNIIITVKDTGIGIPDEVKPKLFTPLFTTKSKGQGFGLAVVKRMTEALNGTVTLESQQGKGTKFIITLPQKP